jgi:AcrR family transcriptional regulator
MGRKKTYTREEAADRALQTFWAQGFHGTSLRDLEASTGVNRFGLYDTFQDKQGLFRECLERYCASAEEMLSALLPRGVEGLIELIQRFAAPQPDDPSCEHGCLVVSSLLERESLSPATRVQLDQYVALLLKSIHTTLLNGQAAGTVRADLDLEECVGFFHLFLVGLPTMARIDADDSSMRLAAKAALRTIESWRA